MLDDLKQSEDIHPAAEFARASFEKGFSNDSVPFARTDLRRSLVRVQTKSFQPGRFGKVKKGAPDRRRHQEFFWPRRGDRVARQSQIPADG